MQRGAVVDDDGDELEDVYRDQLAVSIILLV